jgi:hypothetical protein
MTLLGLLTDSWLASNMAPAIEIGSALQSLQERGSGASNDKPAVISFATNLNLLTTRRYRPGRDRARVASAAQGRTGDVRISQMSSTL